MEFRVSNLVRRQISVRISPRRLRGPKSARVLPNLPEVMGDCISNHVAGPDPKALNSRIVIFPATPTLSLTISRRN